MMTGEQKHPLNLKVSLFASWLCAAGATSPHTVANNNSFVHLTGNSHSPFSLRGQFISIVVTDVYMLLEATAFFCELAQLLSSMEGSHAKRCLSCLVTLTTPISLLSSLTTSTRRHAPVGQTQHLSRVSCQTLMLTACSVWPRHAAPLRECFKCTNWVMFTVAWDTFDELADMKTSHSTSLCVKICAPLQALTGNCSFLRSRPRRSSMSEASSRLQESRDIIEFPLCHYFIPPIQTAFCVIHARTWGNTLSF